MCACKVNAVDLHYRKIVIIGAAGFIGRSLVGFFEGGPDVVGLDLPELDVLDAASLARAEQKLHPFVDGGAVACINAAGLMDATLSLQQPDRFYQVNGMAVAELDGLCRRLGIGAFVQLSSETVFGAGDEPFSDNGPRVPRHPYGISKLFGELLLEAAPPAEIARIVLRLPVVVGARQAIGNPISMFCEEARKSGTITLFNGGKHRRKFIAVEDVVEQIAAVLAKPLAPQTAFYNVGGHVASMQDIAQLVARKVGDVKILDKPSERQAFSLLSTSDAVERAFGFRPRRSLADIVDALLAEESVA